MSGEQHERHQLELDVGQIGGAMALAEHVRRWHAAEAEHHRARAVELAGGGDQAGSHDAWKRHAPHYAAEAELRLAIGRLDEAVQIIKAGR